MIFRTVRTAAKLVWFAFEVGIILVDYLFTAAWASPKNQRRARAAWLHRSCRRHLRTFSCTVSFEGPVPERGLLVSNHLSYLDILVLSSITPAVFVSKSEVRGWPLFGWLASLAGTVFIQRGRRADVGPVNREIEAIMAEGALAVVFPEGTSTDGTDVLPFRSSLLEPVAAGTHPIAVGRVHYEADGGDPRQDVCYWGDHAFFPHVLKFLGLRAVRAKVWFGTFERTTADRKELAVRLREAVLKLGSR